MHHVNQVDTSAVLDSVYINWMVPVTEKLGRIIDDSIYVREYARLKMQLANTQDKDSLAFYQYEINYMEREIDSISKSVPTSDTTHVFGHLVNCSYSLRKNGKRRTDSTILFMDSTNTIRYSEYMDSAISRTARSM
jgi:hypothetical protein